LVVTIDFDAAFLTLLGLRDVDLTAALTFAVLLTAAFFVGRVLDTAFFVVRALDAGFLVAAWPVRFAADLTTAFFDGLEVVAAPAFFFDGALAATFLVATFLPAVLLVATAFAFLGAGLPLAGLLAPAFLAALFAVLAAAGRFTCDLAGRFNALVLLTTTSGGSTLHSLVSPQQ